MFLIELEKYIDPLNVEHVMLHAQLHLPQGRQHCVVHQLASMIHALPHLLAISMKLLTSSEPFQSLLEHLASPQKARLVCCATFVSCLEGQCVLGLSNHLSIHRICCMMHLEVKLYSRACGP